MADPADTPFRLFAVDDEASILRSLVRVMRGDFNVVTCNDPNAAIDVFTRDGPFDVALVDLNMPEMSGIEVMARLHAVAPWLPVLVLSGNNTAAAAVDSLKAGALDYLTKPLTDLPAAIRILRSAAMNGRLAQRVAELEAHIARDEGVDLIGVSSAMREVVSVLERVAPLDVDVVLTGESGTGKEIAAKYLHDKSGRKRGPFVAVNCGAISETLVDSELFGHKRGSFTGAVGDHVGAFERADGGTLFLDEIGDIPMPAQTRLLRALQQREVQRVGGARPIPVNVRVIAATNANLEAEIAEGNFREDLYFRLNVVNIDLPPLRARGEDVALLAAHFLRKHARRLGLDTPSVAPEVIDALGRYPWPGNVRELENAMQAALALCRGDTVTVEVLPARIQAHRGAEPPIDAASDDLSWCEGMGIVEARNILQERFERLFVENALRESEGNISAAARAAGIDRSNFKRLMNRLGVEAPK